MWFNREQMRGTAESRQGLVLQPHHSHPAAELLHPSRTPFQSGHFPLLSGPAKPQARVQSQPPCYSPLLTISLDSPVVFVCTSKKRKKVKSLICVRLFASPWTVTYQGPLSIGFSRKEYRSGLLFSSPGDLPNPGVEPVSPVLSDGFFTTEPPGKPINICQCRRPKRLGFDPWVGKIPWRRAWPPTLVLLAGEFHGQRRLLGYSP